MIEHEKLTPEKKVGFTQRQREFIKSAYEEVLGFAGCVFPVWDEQMGEYRYCQVEETEAHHIKPRGWCIRVLHINPNVPDNAAPICASHHRVGQRNKPLTREDQDCIHLDSAWALRKYKGTEKPTTFNKVFDQRKKLTDVQVKYWFDLWDIYLLELAEDVMGEYLRNNTWPIRKGS